MKEIAYIVQKKEDSIWIPVTSKLDSLNAAVLIRDYIQEDAPELELRIVRLTLVIDIVDIPKGHQS